MNVAYDMARCGSACEVAARASKGGYAKLVAVRSLIIDLKTTNMYDMRDESLVHRLLVASDKLVDVVATKQLGNREVALATYLNELAVMLVTAKSKGGDAWDVGINRLRWKAAAQAIHDRLGRYGVVDPTALDQKIDVCKTSLASSEEQAGTSG